MRYSGRCHCGAIKVSLETAKAPAALGVRACQCGFCRRHGGLTISDPDGEAAFDAAAGDVVRYRFGLMTCDFLICARCGVYVAAAIGDGPNIRVTLNVAGLGMAEFSALAPAPVDYGAESADERIARRLQRWTPARFLDEALANSSFGPHAVA